jgi:NADPH:quinone reductase-like Zn-dependent oxidoreductase
METEKTNEEVVSKIEENRKIPAKRQKTGGRQKGSLNKITSITRESITNVVADYFGGQKFKDDIDVLKAGGRLGAMTDLAKIVVPKPKDETEANLMDLMYEDFKKRVLGVDESDKT